MSAPDTVRVPPPAAPTQERVLANRLRTLANRLDEGRCDAERAQALLAELLPR